MERHFVGKHGKQPQSDMVEECRIPEACFLRCRLTHLEKIVAGAESARFHVDF